GRDPAQLAPAQAPDLVGLVHVRAAGRVSGDPHHGPRDRGRFDRSVSRERPHHYPPDERAQQPRDPLGRAALLSLTEQQRGSEDLDSLELETPDRFLGLSLHAIVEHPRTRVRTQRGYDEKLGGAVADS